VKPILYYDYCYVCGRGLTRDTARGENVCTNIACSKYDPPAPLRNKDTP
jgi:hypothetical protein